LCRIQDQERTKNLKYRRRLCRIQDYEKTTVKLRDTGELDDEILRFSFCDALGLDSCAVDAEIGKITRNTIKRREKNPSKKKGTADGEFWAFLGLY
jgi:hypothetical protein